MTANRSPLKRPTSSLRRSPRSPIATASSMSFGIPRLVAKRFAVPAGMIARLDVRAGEHVDAALNHPVAAPGEDELGALVERAANLRGRLAALRHLAPERVVDALGCEDAAKLGQPAAERLAGVRDDGDLHLRCLGRGAGRAAGEARRRSARRSPTTTPPATSSGWCMPRYMREVATNATIATASVQATRRNDAVREPRREQQREPAVDRDRRRRVAGRIAGVDRQVLEADDARPMRVDDERRGAVRRRLDARARRRRMPRSATSGARRRRARSTPAMIGSTTPPATIEPISDASRPRRRPVRGEPDVRRARRPRRCPRRARARRVTKNAQADRERRDHARGRRASRPEDDRRVKRGRASAPTRSAGRPARARSTGHVPGRRDACRTARRRSVRLRMAFPGWSSEGICPPRQLSNRFLSWKPRSSSLDAMSSFSSSSP